MKEIIELQIEIIVGNSDMIRVESYNMTNGDIRLNISIGNMSYDNFYFRDNTLLCKHKDIEFLIKDTQTIKDTIRQILESSLVKTIYRLYKMSYIDKLPSKLEKLPNKLNKITPEWLIQTFQDISDEVMNGESIENVIIKGDNPQKITFDLDCHRQGLFRNKSITISKRGWTTIDLNDTPLECSEIENKLIKLINS